MNRFASTLDPAALAHALGDARRVGSRWRCRCPVCGKDNLEVRQTPDGTVLVYCFTPSCRQPDVVGRLKALGLWPAPPSRNGHASTPAPAPAPPATTNGYAPKEVSIDILDWLSTYCAVPRSLLSALPVEGRGDWLAFAFPSGAQKLRRAGSKDIRWVLPDGASRPALWPLPSPGETLPEHIVLCESETDTIVARHLGLPAFAVTAGAGAALKAHEAEALRRRGVERVTLLYDSDEAGRAGAATQAQVLHAAGIEVLVVDLAQAGLLDPLCGQKDVRDVWRAARARGTAPAAVRQALEAAARPWAPEAGESRTFAPRMPTPPKSANLSDLAFFGELGILRSKCSTPRPRLIPLAGVRPQAVRWLWPGRVPLGKLTILDGDPGLGKSLLALDLAARVSRGREMPDGSRSDLPGPAGVVLLTAEDDPADTIRPRLDAAGGDPARVMVLQAVDEVDVADDGGGAGEERRRERAVTLADIEPLRHAIAATGARLVVVDPLMAYTGGTDTHVDARVRELLRPLAGLAQETGCAVVVVRHLNKSGGGNPLYRGGGSIGIIGAARSGLLVAADPDDETGQRKVLAVTKSNLAQPAPALAYAIETVLHEAAGHVPRIRWLGESPHTARSLLAQPVEDGERSALDEAKAFLLDLLGAGPVEADQVRREARAAGIADTTLKRAKALLGVRSVKTTWGGGWQWALPESRTNAPRGPSPHEEGQGLGVGPLRHDGPLGANVLLSPSPGGPDEAQTDDLPFEWGVDGEGEGEGEGEGDGEDEAPGGGSGSWPPLDDLDDEVAEAEAAPVLVRSDGPCPRCGYQLERRTCWKCRDTLCSDCGRWTGSGLRTRCVPCGIKADQRERYG